jgi:ubiquinone/menaquinone biosynthesis C-methylase UbiE
VSGGARDDHYSYTLYADPDTARRFDARRFGGPIGELVAAGQARVLLRFAGPLANRMVLDVGTGTGRAALLIASAGARVTGVDASEEMLAVARQRAAAAHQTVTFLAGDAHRLAFDDQAFDAVVSLRVIMHTPRWQECVAELCRVSRGLVIVDYPSAASFALLQSMWRRTVAAIGARTEPYRVFSDTQIAAALAAGGFRIRDIDRQFVLPIAVHKAINSPRFTTAIEKWLARAGLRRLASPVTVVAERCQSS